VAERLLTEQDADQEEHMDVIMQLSSFSVVVLTEASLSSEHSIRTAPLTSSSSSLAAAVAAICCSGVLADVQQR